MLVSVEDSVRLSMKISPLLEKESKRCLLNVWNHAVYLSGSSDSSISASSSSSSSSSSVKASSLKIDGM